MDYNLIENLEFCKEIVDGYTAFLYYTHIPPTILGLGIALFVLMKNRSSLSARLLSALSITFAAWTFSDLLIWLLYDKATPLMFLWSIIGLLSCLLFAFTFLFIYTFVTERPVRAWLIWTITILILPVALATPTHLNLSGYDPLNCIAIEQNWFIYYYHALGILAGIGVLITPLLRKKTTPRAVTAMAIIGAEFFIVTFLGTSFLASYLVDIGIVPDYGIEQFGILAMAVFMAFLGYVIVAYQAFNLRILGAQALVLALVLPIASQYLFVQSTTNAWLVTLTLTLTIFFGLMLIRSVKREVVQRQHIEQLAQELEKANEQQVVLIHFITHQIKGFVTKSRNIFSSLLEGDFGQMPESVRPLLEEGLRSDTKGAQTIQEILNAANIKSGKVTYAQEPVDLKELLTGIVADLKPNADAKGLALEFTTAGDTFVMNGDRMQLLNAFKNLIDNSVKYTPSGRVDVGLTKQGETYRLVIQDTGIGITPEDMKLLFTEGGHGKDSVKMNVESTGFGLYIVKNIVEAHKGKVWAESNGTGKGSRFIVELPMA